MLAVLAAMFLLALEIQKVMVMVSQQAQRERETELLRIGSAFVQAIEAYYESSPGSVKRWPKSLEDLTDDKRFVGIRRHMRKVYWDPITRSSNWGLLHASDGGINGIYSMSDMPPIRSGTVEFSNVVLAPASRYSDWQFVYQPPLINAQPQPKS
jgi:hypothetical protein